MKVLIITNNAKTLEFISTALVLDWPDVNVVSTQTSTAHQFVIRESPDLIITEITPYSNGDFDVLRLLRQFSIVPIINITMLKKIDNWN